MSKVKTETLDDFLYPLYKLDLEALSASCYKTEIFTYKLSEKTAKVKWQDQIHGTEALKKAEIQSAHSLFILAHSSSGQAMQGTVILYECLSNKILHGELPVGKCSQLCRRSTEEY